MGDRDTTSPLTSKLEDVEQRLADVRRELAEKREAQYRAKRASSPVHSSSKLGRILEDALVFVNVLLAPLVVLGGAWYAHTDPEWASYRLRSAAEEYKASACACQDVACVKDAQEKWGRVMREAASSGGRGVDKKGAFEIANVGSACVAKVVTANRPD